VEGEQVTADHDSRLGRELQAVGDVGRCGSAGDLDEDLLALEALVLRFGFERCCADLALRPEVTAFSLPLKPAWFPYECSLALAGDHEPFTSELIERLADGSSGSAVVLFHLTQRGQRGTVPQFVSLDSAAEIVRDLNVGGRRVAGVDAHDLSAPSL